MPRTATVLLLLSLLLRTCHSSQSPPPAEQKPGPQPPPQPASEPAAQATSPQRPIAAALLTDDIATIMVFPPSASVDDDLTGRRELRPLEAIYELKQSLSEGRADVFNKGEPAVNFSLPDLSVGRHILVIPGQPFYWSDNDQTFPDPFLFCAVGTTSIEVEAQELWEKTTYSGDSPYAYKPPPPPQEMNDPGDPAAAYRGDDMGFSAFNIPYRRNLELRDAGELPEIEILGAGFVEGTPAECGRGTNPEKMYTSPLRDVRVVSTVSHDSDEAIPVLKAARFSVPRGVFTYPNHIQIIGKLN